MTPKPAKAKTKTNPPKSEEVDPIVQTKTWTMKLITYKSGRTCSQRVNDGFHLLELLGLSAQTQQDLMNQIGRNVKVDQVKRTAIVD